MIKTGGERVSPKEIEMTLTELAGIHEVAIVGVPDELLGQAIKVFIVTTGSSPLTEQAILRHCKENLEPFMVPRYVEFKDFIPKLESGKIDKRRLDV